ncbi:glycosyltransferase family 2 protein [Flavobacterium sp. KACC 22758]|jgi:hypothetical protein|uniref:glycosyltransferase n=1 Tax=Flavobacterium sp. KACC 22758 TaxID=3025667 RepID=UPI002366A9E0|nr:glycosyltransferase [Flavobacterium sp. KACC 22758]WDF59114.1 glycosyltransferase family 2 protein [Flavobacterium sp. KACC 22758]
MNQFIELIKVYLRPLVYFFRTIRRLTLSFIYPSKISDVKQIPIIINNRNRFEYLLQLINSLENRGYNNIFIIDNDSTYPPLIDYYKTCKYKVFMLGKNVGHLAMWETDIYKNFIKDYYVYTDSDVVPIEECPVDFLELFWKTLKQKPYVQKVGFSLKIDDLPNSFKNKEEVINWEKQFYEIKVNDNFFEALIDTTFALYRPFMKAGKGGLMYRSAFPYQAHHKPWYVDSKNLSYEENYYIEHAVTSTHWTKLNSNLNK